MTAGINDGLTFSYSIHNTFVHTGLKKHQPGFFFRGDWDYPRDPGISSSMSFTADGK